MVLISPFPDETQPYRLCCCWHMRSSRAPGSGWRRNTLSRVCSSTCTRGGDGEEGGVVKASINSALRQPPPPLAALAMRNARVVIYSRHPVLVLNCLTVATRLSRSLLHTHLLSSTTHTSLAKWSSALFSSPGKHIPFLTKTTPPPRSGVVPPRCDNPRQRRTPSTNLLSIVHL